MAAVTTLAETLAPVRTLWEDHMAKALDRAERQAVIAALDEAGNQGTVTAAETLGIDRAELVSLMKKHGLRPRWESE